MSLSASGISTGLPKRKDASLFSSFLFAKTTNVSLYCRETKTLGDTCLSPNDRRHKHGRSGGSTGTNAACGINMNSNIGADAYLFFVLFSRKATKLFPWGGGAKAS